MDKTFSLDFFPRALMRYRIRALLFFLAVLGITALVTYLSARTYLSRAKLLVRLGRENVTLDPTATLGQSPVVAIPPTRENEINSVLEILTSRFLVEQVVDSVGPEAILGKAEPAPLSEPGPRPDDPPHAPSKTIDDRYRAILLVSKKLDVEAVKKSNIVAISFKGASPELAQTVVARLVEFYLQRHAYLHRTPGTQKFLADQTIRLRSSLAGAEDELRRAKNDTGLVALDIQRLALVTRLNRLEDDNLQTATNLAATEAEVQVLRTEAAGLSPTHVIGVTRGMPGQAIDTMRTQLYTLQVKEQELLAKLPEQHPDVLQIRKQVNAARDILGREERAREQVTTGPSRLYEEAHLALLRAEHQTAALKARANMLHNQLKEVHASLKELTQNEMSISRLQQTLEMRTAQYRKYAENYEQAQIDHALEAERLSNISIVEPATYDVKPVAPNVLFNLALGFGLALIGSVSLALLSTYREPSKEAQPPPKP